MFAKLLCEAWPLPVAAAYANARLLTETIVMGLTYIEYPSDRCVAVHQAWGAQLAPVICAVHQWAGRCQHTTVERAQLQASGCLSPRDCHAPAEAARS